MNAVRGLGQLATLFAAGLLVGSWAFSAPWLLGYPGATGGGWARPTWSNVWVGAIVIGVSALALAIVSAASIHGALRGEPDRTAREEE